MIQIKCPSGFAGTARRLKGHEVQAMADQLEGESEDIGEASWGSILTGPWQAITDPGSYSFLSSGELKPDWLRLLKGDVIGVLIQLRIGSFRDGHMYEFDYQCSSCGRLVPWEIDLLADILPTMQPLGEAGRAWLRDGTPLVAQLFDGTQVEFCLGTFAGERPMNKLRRQLIRKQERTSATQLPQDVIAQQTLRVDGKELDIRRRYQWAKGLDMDDLLDLQEQFEAADCGYDTTIEVRCNVCRARQELNLPLAGSFLVPKRRRRKRRRQPDELDEPSTQPKPDEPSSSGNHEPATSC